MHIRTPETEATLPAIAQLAEERPIGSSETHDAEALTVENQVIGDVGRETLADQSRPLRVAVDGHLLIVTSGVGGDEHCAAITAIHDPVEELPLVDDVGICDQKIVRSIDVGRLERTEQTQGGSGHPRIERVLHHGRAVDGRRLGHFLRQDHQDLGDAGGTQQSDVTIEKRWPVGLTGQREERLRSGRTHAPADPGRQQDGREIATIAHVENPISARTSPIASRRRSTSSWWMLPIVPIRNVSASVTLPG